MNGAKVYVSNGCAGGIASPPSPPRNTERADVRQKQTPPLQRNGLIAHLIALVISGGRCHNARPTGTESGPLSARRHPRHVAPAIPASLSDRRYRLPRRGAPLFRLPRQV